MAGEGFTLIDSVTTTGTSTNSITLSNIPGTYRNLQIIFGGVAASGTAEQLTLTVNNVTSNYEYGVMWSGAASGAGNGNGSNSDSYGNWGYINGVNNNPKHITHGILTIFGYSRTDVSRGKPWVATTSQSGTRGSSSNEYLVANSGGSVDVTGAITSITFKIANGSYNFHSGCSARLYGWGIPE